MSLYYQHVDVFSSRAFSGNCLPVFPSSEGLSSEQMLRVTQEFRQFEAIFLDGTRNSNTVRARIFDRFEELPFAGHPVIGAAATLHHMSHQSSAQTWRLELVGKTVTVVTDRTEHGYFGTLDQGAPEFLGVVPPHEVFTDAFDLLPSDLRDDLPLEVATTGLRYLVIPVRARALERSRVTRDLTSLLRNVNAQFAVLLDESALEIRHWNNDGGTEDVATGSAAGVIGAYRLRHRLAKANETFVLQQGRFTGRASTLRVQPVGTPECMTSVRVGGDVVIVGHGALDKLP